MEIDEIDRILRAKTPHEVLGIDAYFMLQADSKDKLTKLYRKLSLKVHPDRNHDINATKVFQRLNSSYEHLLKKPSSMSIPKKDVKQPNTKEPATTAAENVYCAAKTEKEAACKNRATTGETYCHSHRNFDPHEPKKPVIEKVNCRATCKDDSPCSKSAAEGSLYCKIHVDYDPLKPKIPPKVKIACAALTKAGQSCSKYADANSPYCKIHKPSKL